ncbi:hypothetical protein THAOC_23687, partial [Thalassiosira oceanica]
GGTMNELRKRARTGNDRVTGAPAAEAPELPKLAGDAAATKIAELQAELEAIKQSHEAVVDKLNAKVDALQAKNESQLREIKDLTSALQWAYAVDGIPRRHWLGRGHSEEYADAMENLLNSMKQNIETLRVGGDCETIAIDFDLRSEDENYIRADLDESLMPYWKEFAAALRHWSEYHGDGKYLRVEIIYIELPKSVLDILLPALEQSRIKDVYFENSHHAGDMADFAKKVLQANHFITEVGFGEIKFAREDVKAICGAIKSRNVRGHFIKRLAMTGCFEGVPAQLIPMILGKCNHSFPNCSKELTDIYLELTSTTRCQKHDVWDSLEETKSLNCLYNLTRSWVVPSIFV